jgi:hypothetical protein
MVQLCQNFFCGLFYDTANSWTIYCQMVELKMKDEWEKIWKQSWSNHITNPAPAWREWGKPQQISVRISNVPDMIQTEHLLRMGQKYYHSAKTCGKNIMQLKEI